MAQHKATMVLQRVVTGAIMIPVLTASIRWGGELLFLIIVLLLAGVGLTEYFRAALPDEHIGERVMGTGLGLFILICIFLESRVLQGNGSSWYFLSIAGCATSFFVLFFYSIFTAQEMAAAVNRMALKMFGMLYVCLFFSYMILLRAKPQGPSLILFLLFVTWAGDAGSYIVGSWKGKRPLCPRISPKKTVEGAAGGFIWGISVAAVSLFFLFKGTPPGYGLMIGAGINIMNQLGDLSESIIKRAFGIKDSGVIFPGHGGVLDRIDSLLFAAPFLFYCAPALITA